jgi:hypothetical protein
MSYKILEMKAEEDVLKTVIEIEYADKSKETVEVCHFQPETKEAVLQSIDNRIATEERRKAAAEKCLLIKADLEKAVVKEPVNE